MGGTEWINLAQDTGVCPSYEHDLCSWENVDF